MKDYYYNDNNVLVPRPKTGEHAARPTSPRKSNTTEERQAHVGSPTGRRRGEKKPQDEEEMKTQYLSPSQRRNNAKRQTDVSFWESDAESSADEAVVIVNPSSPDRSKSPRFSMKMLARKSPSATRKSPARNASASSDEYFTAQEQEAPERRAPPRAPSDYNTAGSFDSSDEEDGPKCVPLTKKLGLAASRMSGADFTFAKKKGTMSNYGKPQSILKTSGHSGGSRNKDSGDDSNHSSASKTSGSIVSGAGWSTGKDTSSDEEAEKQKVRVKGSPKVSGKRIVSRLPGDKDQVAVKRGKCTDGKEVPADISEQSHDGAAKQIKSLSRKKSSLDASAHSTASGFSFISANSMSLESSSIGSDESGEGNISSSVKDEPGKRRIRADDLKLPIVAVKESVMSDRKSDDWAFDLSAMQKKTEEVERTGDNAKASKVPLKALKEKEKTKKPIQEKKDKQAAQEKFLEQRRADRAARLEKAKERIRKKEEETKGQEAEERRKKKKKAAAASDQVYGSEKARRERAYMWYTRCGMPNREKMKKRIKTIQSCDIVEEDIDLLPWMTGDRMVNVGTMMKALREK
jgi:hypothetical protein